MYSLRLIKTISQLKTTSSSQSRSFAKNVTELPIRMLDNVVQQRLVGGRQSEERGRREAEALACDWWALSLGREKQEMIPVFFQAKRHHKRRQGPNPQIKHTSNNLLGK